MPTVLIKRGTLAQIEAARAASQLEAGEQYLVTDKSRIAFATAANAYRIEPRIYTQSTSPTDAIAGDIWIETP